MANEIIRRSVQAMLAHQDPSGAFVASPDFSQYQFCWLRDGSFIASSLDLAGEHEASQRFHRWCAAAIDGVAPRIERALDRWRNDKPVEPAEMPPARFSLDGQAVLDDWPNFQIDGYGTWLWALGGHLRRSGQLDSGLDSHLRGTAELVARYLSAFAFEPCFDVWEENGGEVHTSTLGCVQAGLSAAAALLGDDDLAERAGSVRDYLVKRAEDAGRYQKSSARDAAVDASVLWLVAPFEVLPADDPYFVATVQQVERELSYAGGVRRYAGDTYFGGGSWPVLTCSLGSYQLRAGRREAALGALGWTRSHLDEHGRLAEQFGGDMRDPENHRAWVERWGPPAADLLWSHAMHVVLALELGEEVP